MLPAPAQAEIDALSAVLPSLKQTLERVDALDPKAQDTLNGRVHACWVNPALQPATAAAAAPAKPAQAETDAAAKPR